MTPQEFGKLLRALRLEHLDEETRLPLTQEGLARRAGMTKLAIGKIERGETRRVYASDLLSLALALKLTSRERKEFFFAAVGLENEAVARPHTTGAEIYQELWGQLERIQQPAFIVDVYSDVIAANRAVVELLQVPMALVAAAHSRVDGFNVIRIVFDPEVGFPELLNFAWERGALANIHFFRAASLRYRATEDYNLLWRALMRLPRFEDFWIRSRYDQTDQYRDGIIYSYRHPTLGPLDYNSTSYEALSADGELFFVTYNAMSPSTSEVFRRLMENHGTTVYPLASWPHKNWQELARQ
jgi:transcriptional regulator with XRE-family HTH domain